MRGSWKTLLPVGFFLLCLHHTALSQPDLRAETTASYHTVNFSWSSSAFDCSSQYELNCTGLDSSTSLYVGGFTPSDQCEYRQFGFQSSTSYNCTVSLTSSPSLPLTVSLTTLGQLPGPPERVSVCNITQRESVVIWDPPELNNDVIRYVVSIGLQRQVTVFPPLTSYQASGLVAGTGYTVVVQAVNTAGTGPASTSTPFTTLFEVPDVPQRVSVSSITQSGFLLTWVPQVSRYDVLIDGRLRESVSRGSVSQLSYQATRLSAFTQYHVQVQAVSDVRGPLVSLLVTTLFNVPNPPISLMISEDSRTPQGLSILWSHRSSASNAPLGFNITYTPRFTIAEAIEQQVTVGPNEEGFTFMNLERDQSYRVTIAAFNSAGNSNRVDLDVPPFIEEPSISVRNERRPFIQLRFTGADSCSEWRAETIAGKFFDQLNIICPDCYTPWSAHIRTVSIACSSVPDELVFRAEVVFCEGDFRMCNLNTHIEFFYSLSPSFLLFSNNRILLLDDNCQLYTGSAESTACLTGSSSSIGSVVGGVIGGIIAGVVIALGGAALVFFIVLKCRKSDNEEMEPHPTTSKFPGKGSSGLSISAAEEQRYGGQQSPQNQSDDPGYEFLPVFNKGPGNDKGDVDAEYDIPQVALSGLPAAPAEGKSEYYEIMDPVNTTSFGAGATKGGKGSRFGKKKQAPAAPKSSKQKEKEKASTQKAKKQQGYENVGKNGHENADKKDAKKGYENVDRKDDDGGTPKSPLVPGAKKKFELGPSKSSASSIAPTPTQTQTLPAPPPPQGSTIDAKKTPAKGVKGVVGKGSSPLQAAAPTWTTAEPQEVGGFKAMREKFAANLGGGATVVGESQPSAGQQQPPGGKKRPLIPKSSNSLPGASAATKKTANPKPGGSAQETMEAIPAVLPKPQKKHISTAPNNAYKQQTHQNFYHT